MDARPRILSPTGQPALFLALDGIRLRPVLPEDVHPCRILAEPEVARW